MITGLEGGGETTKQFRTYPIPKMGWRTGAIENTRYCQTVRLRSEGMTFGLSYRRKNTDWAQTTNSVA
jgi:hypothetical protein